MSSPLGDELLEHIRASSAERKANYLAFFVKVIESYFQVNGKDLIIPQFIQEVRSAPWSAEDAIICLDQIVASPPQDIVSIIEDRGWIVLHDPLGNQFGNEEYRQWLALLNAFLKTIYNFPPKSIEEEKGLVMEFRKKMNSICDWD